MRESIFKNLNSEVNFKLDKKHEAKFYSNLGILSNVLSKVSVYLVNEETIDKIYPPEKKKTLNMDCVKEILTSGRFEKESPEELVNAMEKCLQESKEYFQAAGLYIPSLNLPVNIFKDETNFPAIFICPERCISWAQKLNIPTQFMFIKVLYHELSHAFLDAYPKTNQNVYKTWWGNLIEESLANLITLTRFENESDKAYVTKIITSQPVEYRGCFVLKDFFLVWGGSPDIEPPVLKHLQGFKNIFELSQKIEGLSVLKEVIVSTILSKVSACKPQNLIKLWKEYKENSYKKDLEKFFKVLALEVLKYL